MDYLFEKGLGYNAGKFNVPIVVGASLYDLEYKNFAYPPKRTDTKRQKPPAPTILRVAA